jgi:hypothetical protein
LNYEATGKFVDHLQSNIKERIKLVICLDALTDSAAQTNNLYIIPGPLADRDSIAKHYIKDFEKTATKRGVKSEVKDSTYGSSEGKKFIQYEHVIYEEKGIPAVTISAKEDLYVNRYQKYSVFDRSLNTKDLKKNLLVITEPLMKLIYTFTDKNINLLQDNDPVVDEKIIEQAKTFLSATPRAPHMILRDSQNSKEMQKLFSQNVKQVRRMGVTIKDVQFYEEKYQNKILTYVVTHRLIEIYIFFAVLGYLIVLYLVLQNIGKKYDKSKVE